jgi:hypothetical protein
VKFVADPFILYGEFFLERFDKSLADVAERSNKIGKDPDIHVVECLRKWSLNWNNIYKTSRNIKRFFFRRIFNHPKFIIAQFCRPGRFILFDDAYTVRYNENNFMTRS